MGAHDFLKTALQLDVSAYSWVPLMSISGVCFIAATGMNVMPYVVAAEVLPQRVRHMNSLDGVICMFTIFFFSAASCIGNWELHGDTRSNSIFLFPIF